jgi:glycosyltransferase involved in cell wall biosynthesis
MADRVRALVPGVEVRVILNGLDGDDWACLPSEREQAAAWRSAHVPAGRRTIGLVGQLKRKKGAMLLLDALQRSGLASRFHVVLVGELEPAVVAWLAAHEHDHDGGLSTTVLPFLDRYELLRVLPACDVVALPSFYDGLPNLALEAAALGIPLLSSDAGGLADLVDDTIGFRFPAGDVDACRAAVTALAAATEHELRARGEAAAARVRSSFTAVAETGAYVDLLHATAPGRRPS